jgi:tetratricopeptide (TPR) repeat protein
LRVESRLILFTHRENVAMLNNTQKQIMEATFQYLFDGIKENVTYEQAILGLKAITDDDVYQAEQIMLTNAGIKESVDQVRHIYRHPSPHTRAHGNPSMPQEPGIVVWRDQLTHQTRQEPLGLLGLTAQNDNTAELVTARDVKEYIHVLINQELVELQAHLITQQQTIQAQLQSSSSSYQPQVTLPISGFHPEFFTTSTEILLEKAKGLVAQSKHFEAMSFLNQLVNLEPHHAEYIFLRGKSLAHLGRRDEALQDFNRSLKWRPKHAQTLIERAFTLENHGDVTGALRDYTEALQINTKHAFALCQRAGLYIQIGSIVEGEKDYLTALAIEPRNAYIYESRGYWMLLLERYEDAISDFEESLRLRPDHPKVAAMLQEAKVQQQRFEMNSQQVQSTRNQNIQQ